MTNSALHRKIYARGSGNAAAEACAEEAHLRGLEEDARRELAFSSVERTVLAMAATIAAGVVTLLGLGVWKACELLF